jgi:cation:H+ antiporter
MSDTSPAFLVPLFVLSLAATLAAARSFARRLDRHATALGMPEALVGVLTALAADSPEIASALVALVTGARAASVGVIVGSNAFNLAAMIGASALLAGSVRLPREALFLEGTVGGLVLLAGAAILLGVVPSAVAAGLTAVVLVPYVLLLVLGRRFVAVLPLPDRLSSRLGRALSEHERPDRKELEQEPPAWHQTMLFAWDVALIVVGSIGMVQTALALGDRWHLRGAVVGVVVLAPLTSLPNAITAVRLGLQDRGSALVSETFNSNTINLVAGVIVPSLFTAIARASLVAKLDLAWLGAMTVVVSVLLARAGGLRRAGAGVLVWLYAGFVVLQFLVQ